jgi:hypothetical protein
VSFFIDLWIAKVLINHFIFIVVEISEYLQFKNAVCGRNKHRSWASRFYKTLTFVTEHPQYQMTIGLIPCDETSFFVYKELLANFFGMKPNGINCNLRQHGMNIVKCPEVNYLGRHWTKRYCIHEPFDAISGEQTVASATQYARDFRYERIPGKGCNRTIVQFAAMAPIAALVTVVNDATPTADAVSDTVAPMRDAVSDTTSTDDALTDANAADDADTAVVPLNDALSASYFCYNGDMSLEDDWEGDDQCGIQGFQNIMWMIGLEKVCSDRIST